MRWLLRQSAALVAVLSLLTLPASPAGAITGTISTKPVAGTAAVNGPVYASAVVGNVLVVGGSFSSVGGQRRVNLAALDATTGKLLSWRADTNGTVWALGAVNGMIAVGGSFSTVAGQARPYVAVITTTGAVRATAWRPSGPVLAVAGYGSTLYFGGTFATVNGVSLRNLASADVTSGALRTTWAPKPDGRVSALRAWNSATLLVGGSYSHIGGLARPNLAGVSQAAPGNALSSYSFATSGCPVLDIAASAAADRITVGCAGSKNGGNRFQAFNHAGGAPLWVHRTNGNVQAMVIVGNMVYAGGHFSTTDGLDRKHIAAANLTTGQLSAWHVTMNSAMGVWAEAATSSRLWVGGEFTLLQGDPVYRLGGFAVTG
ncbi:MAG TPA: hypothetical protein VFJ97_05200 [Dermatophilaceae bacterium]|nr:hypothetical protein [Dermatophilaceae bacterium]